MCMCSRAALALVAALAFAQEGPLDRRSSLQINLPTDSPVALLSADLGQSRATARGGAMVLDLHMNLALKNAGQRRVRGVTLLVLAQELTPGGKASVAVPSLNVAPGASFPVRIDLRLLRPLLPGAPPPVRVSLDGVLFDDLSFYGPNRLDSRRTMTAWEMEAQRDRKYFKAVLAAYGSEGLAQAARDSLVRQAVRPRLDVRVSRGRAVSSAGELPDREARFAFLRFPDSPVEPVEGVATLAGNEARAPRIRVVNRSNRPVRYFEIGWIVRDRKGTQFWAASVPGADLDVPLPPGGVGGVLRDTSLRFAIPSGEPVVVDGMTGFVTQVEFADGGIWVPERSSLEAAKLLSILAPSPEEQRLTDLFRTKGLAALVDELRKF